VCIALGMSTLSAPARADAVDDYVERGIQKRRQREDAEALDLFRRAYEMRPTAKVRVQIALAEQALGRWIDAETDLEEALKTQSDPWIDRNRDKFQMALDEIREHLGWVEVESQEGAE